MESCDKCIDYRWIQSSVQKYDLCIFNDLGTAKLEEIINKAIFFKNAPTW
jgi:hypothetical protein